MSEDFFFDDPELQQLEAKYGAGYVLTALNVQQSIAEDGIRGIEFMGKSEKYLKTVIRPVTYQKTSKHIRRNLKRNGL